jgi:hypothetical protein
MAGIKSSMVESKPSDYLELLHQATVIVLFWGGLAYYFSRADENEAVTNDVDAIVYFQHYYLWAFDHLTQFGGLITLPLLYLWYTGSQNNRKKKKKRN